LRLLRLRLELDRLLLQCPIELVQLVRARLGFGAGRRLGGEAHRLLLRRPPIGEVARDFREADYLAALVAQRRDDHVRPEARAVLSDAPSLVLEPAMVSRGHELHLRLPRRDVRRGIEGREVATDDLVRLVALELPRADVPGQDLAVRVEGEDGIVADARDEQPIELGGFVRTLV
jgi:hypothetical protein